MRRFACLVLLMGIVSSERTAWAETKTNSSPRDLIAADVFDPTFGKLNSDKRGVGWKGPWKTSRVAPATLETTSAKPGATPFVQIRGTGARNNPLRRQLAEPIFAKELFVRFSLNYRGEVKPDAAVDPEFFVLWLDRLEGSDRATHASNLPNIGVHIADRGPQKGKNEFMIRVGPAHTAWSKIELKKNRTYQVVARLSKRTEAMRTEYDRLDLWVDPNPEDLADPAATVKGVKSTSFIKWAGFSTGLKTEADDQIEIGTLVLAKTWQSVLKHSPEALVKNVKPKGIAWNKPVDFKRDVFPLLKSRCFECHAGENPDSGYRLDVHREFLGYSTGEVLAEPRRSFDSRLIEVVSSERNQRIPEPNRRPEGKNPLSEKEVALLRAWIDQGMKWNDELLPPPKRESDHWAFQPIARPAVPVVGDDKTAITPVDAFLYRAQKKAGVKPLPEASKQTLIRRLYLDLIGLPPTPEELAECLADDSPRAYENLVERLLSSPHYGERWGRYWLDLARWAESQGYQHDIVRPFAWRYRDYVIESFNKDKPYDVFLKEQIAGDELSPYSDENLIATGFLGAARISGNQEDEAIQRNDVLVDIVNATGSVFLGLTIECAQCHNHKFDPVSQRDYYRLQGFFCERATGECCPSRS